MGQVTVTMNGRTYRLRCGDGEEERLLSVAGHVRGHVERLTQEHGQIGDERLILMAAILVTDELFELRDAIRAAPPGSNSPMPAYVGAPAPLPPRQHLQAPAFAAPHGGGIAANVQAAPAPYAATAAEHSPAPRLPPPNPRALEQLDATALMKGVEKKTGRF
jgi:cell division protein ZapA (FtsZ GTPase activity inhibitor)